MNSKLKIQLKKPASPIPQAVPAGPAEGRTPARSLPKKRRRSKWSARQRGILLGLLFGASATGIGWSVGKLGPMNQRQELLNREVSALTQDVAKLELAIHPMDQGKIESDYSMAIQALFDESTGFPKWQQEVQQQAQALGLQVRAFLGNMKTQAVAKGSVRILPATLEIRPLEGTAKDEASAFQRLNTLNAFLLDPARKVELIDLKVTATTNSIERVEETLYLWFPHGEVQR